MKDNLNSSCETGSQNIILENRKKLSLTGIKDVKSFDEKKIVAFTILGKLTILGEDLKIKKLSLEKSELEIKGKIYSLTYSQNMSDKSDSFISRLFR